MADCALTAGCPAGTAHILTDDALDFVAELHRRFQPRRDELLEARARRQEEITRTGRLDFLPETADVRSGDWSVATIPGDLRDRRVEITGPTDRKMAINALNSGARVWLADLEDANSPTWVNMISGQANLVDAVRRTITLETGDRTYRLRTDVELPTIVMRPRGWHLDERHVLVDGAPLVAALMDFGLYFFHNARELLARGSGPYFYLPKLESHLEARLWNDVFVFAQRRLGIPVGTIRATVLIETITAAFEMEEILYELREHASGLNAGRWDYLFSLIKRFRSAGPRYVLPDRNSVTMTAPMMRAYTELLVTTCHRRGASAIGGMAAFIPSRRDPQVNEAAQAKVDADKRREATDGFDGSWVAHPDLVPVCQAAFDAVLRGRPNQLDRRREHAGVTADQLLDVAATEGSATEDGLRTNVSVSLQYVAAWLSGAGAVAVFNMMEDVATAEIARSQLWQWIRNDVRLDTGALVTIELVRRVIAEEFERIRAALGAQSFDEHRFALARQLLEDLVADDDFVEFLTLPAYRHLD